MKKFILLLSIFALCLLFTSCTITKNRKFDLYYDEVTQSCVLENISEDDFKELKVTVVLRQNNGFEMEIVRDIGDFESGQETVFDITEVNEGTELKSVTLKSYSYYVNVAEIVFGIVATIICVGLVITLIGLLIQFFKM